VASCDSLRDLSNRPRRSVECKDNKYTALFQDAQREIGIPEEDILPIQAISRDNSENHTTFAATATNKIIVIPENFDTLPRGAQRITALHEAFHHKYHDSLFETWLRYKIGASGIITITLSTASLWGLIYSRGINSRSAKIALYMGTPIATFVVLGFAHGYFGDYYIGLGKPQNKYVMFKEFRADRDAVKHVRCYKCVQEYRPMATQPYLTKDELDVYINKFKKENALCDHHKQ